MTAGDTTHVSFSDESHWSEGQYRSICLVSLSKDDLECLEDELSSIINRAGINEFKWTKLKSRPYASFAQEMCDFAIRSAVRGQLRIDVLIWDMTDSRHSGGQVDDARNLGIMYHHLFRNVLRMRWPHDALWTLYPDQHNQIDWETVEECLEHVSTQIDFEAPSLLNETGYVRLLQEFGLAKVCPVESHGHPLLQLADLFAGLSVFSHEKYAEYVEWQKANPAQPSLLPLDNGSGEADFTKRSKSRFSVLQYFDSRCKSHKLGVSLKGKKGLQTHGPHNPLNFWMYEPQHPADRAPQKV